MKLRCYNIEWDEHDQDLTNAPKEVVVTISKRNYNSGKVQVVDLITKQTGLFLCSHEHEVVV